MMDKYQALTHLYGLVCVFLAPSALNESYESQQSNAPMKQKPS